MFLIFLIHFSTLVYGQNNSRIDSFKIAFASAANTNFSTKALNNLFNYYSALLTPHSDVTQLGEKLRGHEEAIFPLSGFKNERIYQVNIDKLLSSKISSQRILAYLLVASSYDTSKEKILLAHLKTEKNKLNLIWNGMALLALGCNHTSQLFDFLVKNEDFGDAHMLPMFFHLDKDSLQQTALNRINNSDIKSKILAAQMLAKTAPDTTTEKVLKHAVQSWEMNIKGYAIFSLGELQAGNLLDLLKPLLANTLTRSVSLDALANSPTEEDKNYLVDLVNIEDTVDTDLLNAFYDSKNPENVKYWLKLLYTKNLPSNYFFPTFNHPLISPDSVLEPLHFALNQIQDYKILGQLVRALMGRNDDTSVDIMLHLLRNKSATVRYWTARTLEMNTSEKLKTEDIRTLITKGLEDGNNPD